MNVRPATLADLPRILEMVRAFFDASPFGKTAEFDTESASAMIWQLIDGNDSEVMLAVDDEAHVVGMAGMGLAPLWFAPKTRMASEVFWYVDPKSRSKGAGLALLEAMVSWARERGAHLVTLAHFHGKGLSDAGIVYREYGFDALETAYTKKVS
jgi:GNAT superfamily N-acetyltransferase